MLLYITTEEAHYLNALLRDSNVEPVPNRREKLNQNLRTRIQNTFANDQTRLAALLEAKSLEATVAAGVRRHRIEAGWTQGRLAEAARGLGLGWKRITVVEMETGRRKLGLRELLIVAAMFGVPVVDLLVPEDEEATIDLNLPDDFGYLTGGQLRELFTGHTEPSDPLCKVCYGPGEPEVTLWDCDCPECLHLQKTAP